MVNEGTDLVSEDEEKNECVPIKEQNITTSVKMIRLKNFNFF